MSSISALWPILGWTLLAVCATGIFIRVSGAIRYIFNNRLAVVEKLWAGRGSIKSGLIALNGEAGFQPDTLRGGVHFFTPFQYRLHIQPLVTIPQGRIGYVFARDGRPLDADQALAANPEGADFQNVRAFLKAAARRARSARCCAKAPTPSTSPSSWW